MSTFVLVHGAFLGGWCWADVVDALEVSGHRAVVVEQLPSCGPDPATGGGLLQDAAAVHAVLDRLENGAGPAVLVGHSYAGMVITELADHPAVAMVVYLAAVWPRKGESGNDVLAAAGGPSDWIVPRDDGTAAVSEQRDRLQEVLGADLTPAAVEHLIDRMRPLALAAITTPSRGSRHPHPTAYLVCDRDAAFPPAAQNRLAAGADRVAHLPASHHPMISAPAALADALTAVTAAPSRPSPG